MARMPAPAQRPAISHWCAAELIADGLCRWLQDDGSPVSSRNPGKHRPMRDIVTMTGLCLTQLATETSGPETDRLKATGLIVTAVPYAMTSVITSAISLLSNRIAMTAFAPRASAASASRSRASLRLCAEHVLQHGRGGRLHEIGTRACGPRSAGSSHELC